MARSRSELDPERRGAAVLLVQQHGELVARQPARSRGQQEQHLAVPGTQPNGPTMAAPVVDREQSGRSSEGFEPHGETGRPSCVDRYAGARMAGEQLPGQLGLGHPSRGPDHGRRLRNDDVVRPGDVENAEQATGRSGRGSAWPHSSSDARSDGSARLR